MRFRRLSALWLGAMLSVASLGASGPGVHLIVDSTGLSIVGDGECASVDER